MESLPATVARVAAESGFSGVVRADRGDEVLVAEAFGLADRAWDIANTVDTRFAIASGAKGFTALTVVSLIEDGTLRRDTRARDVLGDDLPLIDAAVTVEHLLGHRSGIGDYLDENAGGDILDYVMPVPVHELAEPEQYLAVLGGYPMKFTPGEEFSYCNGGYVVLALIAERAAGVPFTQLVAERVCAPAGLMGTEHLRSDGLPRGVARGYLHADGLRTNVLHLPVVGVGDGGIFTTAAEVHALWRAVMSGQVVSPEWVEEMVRPHSDVPGESARYGLGFWLHAVADRPMLLGYDAGVSFRSSHDRATGVTATVIANTAEGAWPMARHLEAALLPSAG